jgi:hypothetical protein
MPNSPASLLALVTRLLCLQASLGQSNDYCNCNPCGAVIGSLPWIAASQLHPISDTKLTVCSQPTIYLLDWM